MTDTPSDSREGSIASTQVKDLPVLETENFIDTYQIVAGWIRFADAKAAAVLAAGGALAGVLIPSLQDFLQEPTHLTSWWKLFGVGLFSIWLVLLMLSCWKAFQCIMPFRKSGKHPALGLCNHFHPASISASYAIEETDRFTEDSSQLTTRAFMKEVMAGLHLDSHISSVKYKYVSRAIQLLAVSAIFGFMYLVAAQF